MTYSKEDLAAAFDQVLRERVPDLSEVPKHIFSDRFEQRMQKLIRREAAHPWAVSHTAARNLLVAALIAVLLFALSMSVSGVRNAIYHFFTRHFDDHDDVIFDDTGRSEIEYVYDITALPDGFVLKDTIRDNTFISRRYEKGGEDYIIFQQAIPMSGNETSIDNERSKMDTFMKDDQIYFGIYTDETYTFTWEKDGYEFLLIINSPRFNFEQTLYLCTSVE